jgi:hypothetical protein
VLVHELKTRKPKRSVKQRSVIETGQHLSYYSAVLLLVLPVLATLAKRAEAEIRRNELLNAVPTEVVQTSSRHFSGV